MDWSFSRSRLDQDLAQLKKKYSQQEVSGLDPHFPQLSPKSASWFPGLHHYNLSYLSFRGGDFSQSVFHLLSAQNKGVIAPFVGTLSHEIEARSGFPPPLWSEKLIHGAVFRPTMTAYSLGSLFLLFILLLLKFKVIKRFQVLLFLCLVVTMTSFYLEQKLLALRVGVIKKDSPIYLGPQHNFASTFEHLPEGLSIVTTRLYPQWVQFFHPRGLSGWTKRENILLVDP